ncbi:GGDEF domain-containing protein [uncultured Devosia sp.]|uniref:GGDEF domain-containing protein n=1 Tax=uncultured Devosia sp. TaxID=211434 RepID=UPI002627C0F2|nr:GGDEF domain-containing protein [uncultured Devosia sp.]
MIDNATLLIGIAFSSASLTVALLIGWLNARHEKYLVHGGFGVASVAAGASILGLREGSYDLFHTLLPYTLVVVGLSLIYSGSRVFRDSNASLLPAIAVVAIALPVQAVPFLMGYSGIGAIVLNIAAGVFMLLCAREYWLIRREAWVALVANSTLYVVVALSFFACAVMLVLDGNWVLTAPADNWAEDLNSILSLTGLTGIGAITLTLHHARAARRHRLEANTDALTGVLNRRALFQRFAESDSVTGLAVIMFDLDHFKQINDRMGHAHGDFVLTRFADILRQELRHSDAIARLGGEEFCAILPGRDRDAARQVAEHIRKAFADLALAIDDEGKTTATVSAGMATAGVNETFSSVLSRADSALYKAKQAGRNQVHVAPFRLVA